jgi:hypothetical protein
MGVRVGSCFLGGMSQYWLSPSLLLPLPSFLPLLPLLLPPFPPPQFPLPLPSGWSGWGCCVMFHLLLWRRRCELLPQTT